MDPGYFDIERKPNPREKANPLSKATFWYTRPLFAKGRKGQLSISDVYRCTPGHRAAPRGDQLGEKWRQELEKKDKGRKPSLLRAIIKIYGLKFIIGNVLFAFVDASIRLSIPMCLEGLINYFSPSHNGVSTNMAYLYAAGVVGFMAINASMMHPMLLWLLDMSMKIRVACCSLIYRKLIRLELNGGASGLSGRVLTLLTADAPRFDMACLFMVDLVRTPIESVLIVFLMYRQIGVATLVGVAFLLLFIPLQGYLGKISSKLRRKTAVRTDNRIRLMNEVIQSIEAIKMYAWENAFARIIGEARKKEMNIIKKMSWLRAVMISCVKLNTKVAIFLSIISFLSFNNDLTAAKVFVIFSYYEILKYTLVDFLPLAITFTLEAYVSVKRMQEFLLLPEVDNHDGVDLVKIDEPSKVERVFEKIGNGQQAYIRSESNLEKLARPQALVSLKDFTAHWTGTDADGGGRTLALSDVNLVIKAETLTTIIGTVGSGKSTVLHAILRELPPSQGHLEVNGAVAYAAQDPWLFEASVRQNILFGQDMDLRRYKQVIKCCQLKSDLEILSHGDKTIVGERGASLSGGQRARISLARCVYQHADVYLLDDPLAAVDAKVAQAIYEECIRGFLRDKATVLVTHHAIYARHAHNVCVMRSSKIVAQGTYRELQNGVQEFDALLEMNDERRDKQNVSYENQETVEHSHKLRSQRSMSEASQLSFNLDLDNNLDPAYEGEVQNKGSVDNSVYIAYIKSGGGAMSMSLLFTLFILAQLFYSSTDVWLKEWVNMEEANSAASAAQRNSSNAVPPDFTQVKGNTFHLTREQCVYVYAALIGICIFFTWNKLVVFYNTCIRASVSLHDTMFRGVTNAPMWFFHHNPSGRILNRFSKDIGQVDTLLPVALVDCLGVLPRAGVRARGALQEMRNKINKLTKLRKRLFHSLLAVTEPVNLETRDKNKFIQAFKETAWYNNLINESFDLKTDIHKSISTLINWIVCKKKSYAFDALKFETKFSDDVPEEELVDVHFENDQEIEFPDIILDDEKGIPVILFTELNLLNKIIFKTSESDTPSPASFSKFTSTMECPLFLMNDEDLNDSVGYFYTLDVYKQLLEKTTKTEPRTRRPYQGGLVLVDTDDFDAYNDYIISATYFNFKKVNYNIGLFYFVLWKICEKKEWMDRNVVEQFKKYMLRRVKTTVCMIGLSSLPLDPRARTSLPTALWYCVELSSDIFKSDPVHFAHERLRRYYEVAPHRIEILKYLQYDMDLEYIRKRRDLVKHVMLLKKLPSRRDKVFYLVEKIFKNVNGFVVSEIENEGNVKKLDYLKLHHKEMLSDDVVSEDININDYVYFLHQIDDSGVQICETTLRPYFMIDENKSFYSELYDTGKQVVVVKVDGKVVLNHEAMDRFEFSKILSYHNLFVQCVKGLKKFPTLEEYSNYILKKRKFKEELVTVFPVNVNDSIERAFFAYQNVIKDKSVSEFVSQCNKYASRLERIKTENIKKFKDDEEILEFIAKEEHKVNFKKAEKKSAPVKEATPPEWIDWGQ